MVIFAWGSHLGITMCYSVKTKKEKSLQIKRELMKYAARIDQPQPLLSTVSGQGTNCLITVS